MAFLSTIRTIYTVNLGVFDLKIAIVGFGIAGASSLVQLYNQIAQPFEVDIYEPRPRLGAGAPYGEDDEAIVVNSFPRSLSLDENNDQDFIEWMQVNHPEYPLVDKFPPRTFYGAYVNQFIQPYLEKDQVHHIPHEVSDMQVVDEVGNVVDHRNPTASIKYRLKTDHEWSKVYDAVFLTFGHPPYKDPYRLKGETNFIYDPYPFKDVLTIIEEDQRVGVVGSGLTTIDVVNYFSKHDTLRQPLTIYMRNEPFKSVIQKDTQEDFKVSLTDKWRAQQKAIYGGTIPLQVIIDQLKADLEANQIDYERVWDTYSSGSIQTVAKEIKQDDEDARRFQGFFRYFFGHIESLLNDLSQSDHDDFFTRYTPIFRMIYSQAPKDSIEHILNLIKEDKLRIIGGLSHIESQTDGGFAVYTNGIKHQADVLINATGFDYNLLTAKEDKPLLKNLYERTLIMPDPTHHILVTWPGAQVINRPFGLLDQVFVIGSWISSTQGPNTSVALTKRQAKRSVACLKAHLS